jgi:hypothetical protein
MKITTMFSTPGKAQTPVEPSQSSHSEGSMLSEENLDEMGLLNLELRSSSTELEPLRPGGAQSEAVFSKGSEILPQKLNSSLNRSFVCQPYAKLNIQSNTQPQGKVEWMLWMIR